MSAVSCKVDIEGTRSLTSSHVLKGSCLLQDYSVKNFLLQEGIVQLEQLLGEWLRVLLYCLLHLLLAMHGGVEGNLKNISLMYLVSILSLSFKVTLT